MKNQALFSSKDKSKKLKCRLLQFLFGTIGVKIVILNFLKAHIYASKDDTDISSFKLMKKKFN